MKIFYSKKTNTFFPEELKKIYDASNSWPLDVLEVSIDTYNEFALGTAPEGKIRRAGEDGLPYWEDVLITNEALDQIEKTWVKEELERAAEELNKVQDSDPKGVGSVSDWRAYRRALRAWSESLDYPNKNKRPLAPDSQ